MFKRRKSARGAGGAKTRGTEAVSLLRSETCDLCAAPALVRVEVPSGTLQFCGHHYMAQEIPLAAAGARIVVDERARVAEDLANGYDLARGDRR